MKTIIIAAALLTVSTGAQAEPVMSGDWGRGVNANGTHYALTGNASDSFLGQTCSPDGNCWYAIHVNKVTCEKGKKIFGLISSALGAEHISLLCGNNNANVIEEFDVTDYIVRNASSVGIVIPLQDGKFEVSRFSLRGSTRAINGMRAAAQKTIDQQPAPPAVQTRTADIRI